MRITKKKVTTQQFDLYDDKKHRRNNYIQPVVVA